MKFITYRHAVGTNEHKVNLSLEAQDREIQSYLAHLAPEDYQLIGDFTDVQSGRAKERPELNEALNLARRSRATLIVAKLDCFSMNASFLRKVMHDTRLDLKVAQMPSADKRQLYAYAVSARRNRNLKTNGPGSSAPRAALKRSHPLTPHQRTLETHPPEHPTSDSKPRDIWTLINVYRAAAKPLTAAEDRIPSTRKTPKKRIINGGGRPSIPSSLAGQALHEAPVTDEFVFCMDLNRGVVGARQS